MDTERSFKHIICQLGVSFIIQFNAVELL